MSDFTGTGRYQKAAQEASGIPHSSEQQPEPAEAAAENRPALPCPPWCESHHLLGVISHQLHRDFDDGNVWITLYQQDVGTEGTSAFAHYHGQIDIHISRRDRNEWAIVKPVAEVEDLAAMAVVFGRDDIAAAIREFAALAKVSELSTDGSLPSVYSSPGLSRG